MSLDMILVNNTVGRWVIQSIQHRSATVALSIPVKGIIGNSEPSSMRGEKTLVEWKQKVASETKLSRGESRWDSNLQYAITIGFCFYPQAHGNQRFDIENFVKPTIDALAAGLFCSDEQDPKKIERYNYDDSNFTTMLLQRLADAEHDSEEGVALSVSVFGMA